MIGPADAEDEDDASGEIEVEAVAEETDAAAAVVEEEDEGSEEGDDDVDDDDGGGSGGRSYPAMTISVRSALSKRDCSLLGLLLLLLLLLLLVEEEGANDDEDDGAVVVGLVPFHVIFTCNSATQQDIQ